MLLRLLKNHVLANLSFLLVLALGFGSYMSMPREQDPAVNFNWLSVVTILPGAAATNVEKLVTEVLERKIRGIADVKFVESTSRESRSNILIRFDDIDERLFDKRVADLRREVQNASDELPSDATTPFVIEITTANAYPSATLAVVGKDNDENLRRQAEVIKKDLERIKGVDTIMGTALSDPELHVNFLPEKLEEAGITPSQLADTVSQSFRDTSMGSSRVNDQNWLVRMVGQDRNPEILASLPIARADTELLLGDVAEVVRGREKMSRAVRFNGQPAVMFTVTKKGSANTLELVQEISSYVEERSHLKSTTGVDLVLVDDQTEITRNALRIMQTNALLGLFLVLVVTWLFLGTRISLFTTIGIPFILAGTFWILSSLGMTLNVMVLLGVIIALGMLVDDAVVMVEAIYYRLQRGEKPLAAVKGALKEVAAPITTAVLTTIAVFLPLMLMPGIMGDFMFVLPLVVCVALAISLVEAFWMLPAHILAADVSFKNPSKIQIMRTDALHWIRVKYTKTLIRALRWPKLMLTAIFLLFLMSVGAIGAGMVKMDFFASDPIRLFYISVEMPEGTPVDVTMQKVQQIEDATRRHLQPGETREILSYTGIKFTDTAPLLGDYYGQVLVTLNPKTDQLRSVHEMIDAMREEVTSIPGTSSTSFLSLDGGPPTSKAIAIKVRGDDIRIIRNAVAELKAIIAEDEATRDISDDDSQGQMELILRINQDAARRAGISPAEITRTLRLLVDGEIVAKMQDMGEEVEVRVRAKPQQINTISNLGSYTMPLANGGRIALKELVLSETAPSVSSIRHYNFRRTIKVEADIDKTLTDAKQANQRIMEGWEKIKDRYTSIDLDTTGQLDDIEESLASLVILSLFGLGLVYMILGTQFNSYFLPIMIIATIPMAFIGVVFGLIITNNPLSLYTMYGMIALMGIAFNAAIVLISAANDRLNQGMSVLHATLYAARRRVIPILITTMTTIAGLFSLAVGFGGSSLMWGPIATVIVCGLLVSSLLTLFVIPLLYRTFMGYQWVARRRQAKQLAHIHPPVDSAPQSAE